MSSSRTDRLDHFMALHYDAMKCAESPEVRVREALRVLVNSPYAGTRIGEPVPHTRQGIFL